MSWHFLQELEAASWGADCLDGAPSALLKLMPTAGACYSRDSEMAISSPSQSGTTSEPLTADPGAALSMSSAGDSRAKTLARRTPKPPTWASEGLSQDSGWRWPESWARCIPESHSLRTRQRSLFGGFVLFSATLPTSGIMLHGELLAVSTSLEQRATAVIGSGFWPTPTVQDSKNNGGPSQKRRMSVPLNAVIGGALNPPWVAWLMGWPIGWTDCEPLATDKCQWPQRPLGTT